MKKIAYIAVNGDDKTAQVGDPALPFQTFKAAQTALEPYRQTHVVQIIDLGFVTPTPPPQ